jgi:hypothetical protein
VRARIELRARYSAANNLQGRPVMVSALRDGKVIVQREFRLGSGSAVRDGSLT